MVGNDYQETSQTDANMAAVIHGIRNMTLSTLMTMEGLFPRTRRHFYSDVEPSPEVWISAKILWFAYLRRWRWKETERGKRYAQCCGCKL